MCIVIRMVTWTSRIKPKDPIVKGPRVSKASEAVCKYRQTWFPKRRNR